MERNNRDYRNYRRSSDAARAYTKKKARKANITLASIALVLVAAVATTFAVLGASKARPSQANTNPTSASKVINADGDKSLADKAQSNQAASATYNNNNDSNYDSSAQSADYQQAAVSSNDEQNDNQQASGSAQQDDANVQIINGERIYIDTKRPVPENTGNPQHYNAEGKTSYGFDWNYDTDNGNFVLRCDYNLDRHIYDFQFYGTASGTAHVTLYYNTDDNTQVPVNLTIVVDDDLNVTYG